jgi:hypothetical protein
MRSFGINGFRQLLLVVALAFVTVFTVVPAHAQNAPTVTNVSPNAGPTIGGTTVVITGTGFDNITAVRFGGQTANYVRDSATQITAVTPSYGFQSSASVEVFTSTGVSSVSQSSRFNYLEQPQIFGASPGQGPLAGGGQITIFGNYLDGATAVSFGARPATSFSVSGGQITATVPAGANFGFVSLVVTTPGGTTNAQYEYVSPAPTISAIFPNTGSSAGGTRMNILGNNLSTVSSVTFGGVPALYFATQGPGALVVYTPAGALGPVDVVVTSPDGSVTSVGGFTYIDPTAPSISGLTVAEGTTAGGNPASIVGANFTGATAVSFGGTAVASFTVVSPTRIDTVVPASGSTGQVTVAVTTPGGIASRGNAYTYVTPPASAPTISSVSPSSISVDGGMAVTINGSNFSGTTAVTFNGVAATSFVVRSSNFMVVTAPAGTAGAATVAVTTPAGTATQANAVTYVADPLPVISSISPVSGPVSVGTALTITGTGFTGATAMRILGLNGTSFSVVSPTQITVVTPAGTNLGNVPVEIVAPGGVSPSGPASTFFYTSSAIPAATISAVSPNTGAVAGGTNVTITGTNFSGAQGVFFWIGAGNVNSRE